MPEIGRKFRDVNLYFSYLINYLIVYVILVPYFKCVLSLISGLDERGLEGQQMSAGLYGHRSNSSASSSPPATSQSGQTGLVVPQPINAAKGGQGHGQGASGNNNSGHIHSHPSNGSSGRKYQCKMCPQVGKVGFFY